jgi:hypothetical protein
MERFPEDRKFFFEPAYSDTEQDASLREDIGSCHLLGHFDRVTHRQNQHAGA